MNGDEDYCRGCDWRIDKCICWIPPFPHARAGAYWFERLAFALTFAAASERAILIYEECDPGFADSIVRGRIFDGAYGWDPR